jgi:zinc transport system substrate-binding protein
MDTTTDTVIPIKSMKRLTVILLLTSALLAGCANTAQPVGGTPEKLSIVCATFPIYDWVREILGDTTERFGVTLLMDNLVDLHSYQPSVSEIITIGKSDLFIHVGGHSDGWVEDVLNQATNADMVAVNLLDVLGDAVVTEVAIEGAEHICDEDCDDDHARSGDVLNKDEHVWVSLRLAKTVCAAITDVLAELDPENAEDYRRNLAAYTAKLSDLDTAYNAAAGAAEIKTLLFADRFPFRYLADDYGLNYYAAFSGCSAASEASFSTVVFLAAKADELGLNNIMVTESADESIARTVISNTQTKNQRILVLNAMQSVTRRDVNNGMTYLSVMESNLEVLREALS